MRKAQKIFLAIRRIGGTAAVMEKSSSKRAGPAMQAMHPDQSWP